MLAPVTKEAKEQKSTRNLKGTLGIGGFPNIEKSTTKAPKLEDQCRENVQIESLFTVFRCVNKPEIDRECYKQRQNARQQFFEISQKYVVAPRVAAKGRAVKQNAVLNIVVAVRDRDEQLEEFILHMRASMITMDQRYRIWISEQAPTGIWNKGKLFNAAYTEANKLISDTDGSDEVWLFTDVDIFERTPGHLRYHKCWELEEGGVRHLYGFGWCLGGVFCMRGSTYERVNGFPNSFWGWGGEDRDFQNRLEACGIPILRDGTFEERLPGPCQWIHAEHIADLESSASQSDGSKKANDDEKLLGADNTQCPSKCFHARGARSVCKQRISLQGWCNGAHKPGSLDCTHCVEPISEAGLWNKIARRVVRPDHIYQCANDRITVDGLKDVEYKVLHTEKKPNLVHFDMEVAQKDMGAFRLDIISQLYKEWGFLQNYIAHSLHKHVPIHGYKAN